MYDVAKELTDDGVSFSNVKEVGERVYELEINHPKDKELYLNKMSLHFLVQYTYLLSECGSTILFIGFNRL